MLRAVRIVVSAMALGLCATSLLAAPCWAELPPQRLLANVIHQLQTGTVARDGYSPEVWKTISQQTGGTGQYPYLEKLGSVSSIAIVESTPKPQHTVYAMTATHQRGVSTWQLWVAKSTERVDWLSFRVTNNPPPAAPTTEPSTTGLSLKRPPPAPSAPAAPASPQALPTTANSPSEACRKFPNLC